MKKRSCLGSLFTNIFLAALIIGLYYATQPGNEIIPASAPMYRGRGDSVALQFPLSWNAAALSDIMDTLEKDDINVTFAVSGEWAEQNAETLRNMAAQGHEIAIMGYHPDMDGGLGWVSNDLERALKAAKDACGIRPTLYYVGGRSAAVSSIAAKKLGLTQISCTIDLLTAKGGAEDILARVPEQLPEGSIILLQPTAACSEALPGILSALEQKGLKISCTGSVLGLNELT
ncbi:MAG: polysaccharide deacetylase family protein [Clostridia bacterium]|nr:polysaccharide deacetylase family protein [Clostridia bacterium]